MNNTQTLPQLENTVILMGTIKELNLTKREITYTKDGQTQKSNAITGDVIVVVDEKDLGRVHEHRVQVFRFEGDNKVYKGLETVMAEYKVGDFVRVTANIEANDYMDKEGKEVIEGNKLVGVFFTRIDKEEDQIPSAEAKVKVVIKGYTPITENGQITKYKVDCFTVGYGGKVIPLHKAVTSAELYQGVSQFYPQGMNCVGELSFNVNSYTEYKEKKEEQPQQLAFGVPTKAKFSVAGKRNYDLEIIGGLPAERQFSMEEIQLSQQSRNLALEEVKRKHAERMAKTTPTQSAPQSQPMMAFGTAGQVSQSSPFSATNLPTDIASNMPF